MSLSPDEKILLEAYFDGSNSPETIEAMQAWLAADPAHPRILAEYGLIDRLIAHEQKQSDAKAIFASLLESEEKAEPDFSLLTAAPSFESQTPKADQAKLAPRELLSLAGYLAAQGLRSKAGVIAAVAAVLLLAITLIVTLQGPSSDPASITDTTTPNTPAASAEPTPRGSNTQPVATITATHNAQWSSTKPAGDYRRGAPLHPNQTLTLTAGFAEITTEEGAVVILEAPATIQLINDNALYLHDGKLVGMCYTDTSKGFVVKTDHADVTDLGTEFGVEVSDNHFTATVLTGEIAIRTPGNKSKVLTDDQTATLSLEASATLSVEQGLAKGFEELIPRVAQAHALRNDPAMIAYWGFEAEDIVDGKLLNRAAATQGKMNGTLGQAGKPDSAPTLTEGRRPGTNALRFEAEQFDLVRVPADDAALLNGLEQFTIGLWVKPDHMDQVSHHLVTKNAGRNATFNLGLGWKTGSKDEYETNAVFFHSGIEGSINGGVSSPADSLERAAVWTHLVVTYDHGERSIYINGELLKRLPRIDSGRTRASDADLLIGGLSGLIGNRATYLDGDLDELFILGRVMPHDEITTLYETGVAQP